MKKSFLLLLCACSGAYAGSRALPPVVEKSSFSGGSAHTAPASSTNAMFEVLGRLEQLQIEMQQLRGVVEEQSQTISDLKRRQNNIYSDLEQRIQEISGVSGVQHKPVVDSMGQPDQFDMNNSTYNSTPEQNIIKYPVPVQESSNTSNETYTSSGKSEKELYQAAYETLRNGHNTRAISAFKALLSKFPDGEYADNSLYWLGEAYKVNQDFNSSKAAFSKIVTHFGGSTKVPDALLKLGYIEFEQNNIPKARDYLTQVTTSYPASPAADLATEKLMEIRSMHP